MPRTESVTSPSPPGAGRIRDITYPDYTSSGTASAGLLSMRCRITGANITGGAINNYSALTGPQWQFGALNADTIQMVGGAAGELGGSVSFQNVTNVQIRTSIGMPYWPIDDDWNVHRIVFVAAINGTVSTDNDNGFELLNAGAGAAAAIIRPALPSNGFGFRFGTGGTNGRAFVVARNNASGVTNTLLATDGVGGFDIRKLHAYEFRIFSAMPNVDPFLKVLIDDVLITTMQFAGGTLKLPANGESGAAGCGFFPIIVANASNASGMFIKELSFQSSTTELSCL